ASRLRIMKHKGVADDAIIDSNRGNLSFSAMTNVFSSFAEISLMCCCRICPEPERTAHRRRLGTISAEVTAVPSLHFSPSRSSNVQVSLSSDDPYLPTICGCG